METTTSQDPRIEQWTDKFRNCQDRETLNNAAYAIVNAMHAERPSRHTLRMVISAYKADPCWDNKSNPFEGIITTD